jgi:glycerol-3-phosphate acyltransferase PlsY
LIEIVVIISAYLVGGVSVGYYAVRYLLKKDIRNLGSGSIGARNVGRFLGRRWMIIVFLADFTKGVLAVGLAYVLDISLILQQLTMIAVVIGHVWPAQLGFRGGRGISTTIGAVLVFNYLIMLSIAGITALIYMITRKFIISGLLAIALSPFIALVLQVSIGDIITLGILVCIILFTHRKYIFHFIKGYEKAKG